MKQLFLTAVLPLAVFYGNAQDITITNNTAYPYYGTNMEITELGPSDFINSISIKPSSTIGPVNVANFYATIMGGNCPFTNPFVVLASNSGGGCDRDFMGMTSTTFVGGCPPNSFVVTYSIDGNKNVTLEIN